jgi:hypothetical protein
LEGLPLDKKAIEKAQTTLTEAAASVADMEASKTFHELESAWSRFLVAANRVYTRLEQGAKSNSESKGWFGRKTHERRIDPLLRYIQHARNADEHSIAEITHREPSALKLGIGPGLWKFDGTIGCGGHMTVSAMGGQVPGKSKFAEYTPGDVRLIRVFDRGRPYDPPLDQNIREMTPLEAAKLALSHLVKLIEEAEKL